MKLGGGHNLSSTLAFTLAEVLITLGIIGVVAALTLPVVISKYREKVFMTKLQKHVALMETVLSNIYNETGSIADTYNQCHSVLGGERMSKCFINQLITYGNLNPATVKYEAKWGIGPHAFRLLFPDGSYIAVQIINTSYVVYLFDLNGVNPPNLGGIDRFAVHYYPYNTNYVKKPYKNFVYDLVPINKNQRRSIIQSCSNNADQACMQLILDNNFKPPKDYPLKF